MEFVKKRFWRLFGPRPVPAARSRWRNRFIPRLEGLELRCCPAGTWEWIGPTAANGGDGLWSNPNGID